MIAKTRPLSSVDESRLYVAFELGATTWKLALTVSAATKAWVRTVPSGDLGKVAEVVARARQRFGVPATAPVESCYEAGRDGFWIHRALVQQGYRNRVVDSASIEVNRRARRSKTDRLDAVKLATMLVRVCGGEARVWQEVRVPGVAEEAARQTSRERAALVAESTRLLNQMRSLVATVGARFPEQRVGPWWAAVRDWQGAPLPATVQQRLVHAQARLALVEEQIATLERQQRQRLTADPHLARLVQLRGIGVTSAAVLMDEGLGWRAFQNRRQVGGMLGFRPVPFQSGEAARDVGIDRAGNKRWRSTMVQLAWAWLRWQPGSALAQWFEQRFAHAGKRARRIGIVALARKLLVALWRWATQGVVPAGAMLKAV